MKRMTLLMAIWMTGCVQMPPTAQDIQAKKFEAVPGKAVIYIVRPLNDSSNTGPINLGKEGFISTHPGTYYRWEITPGVHRIEGAGAFTAAAVVRAEAGRIYFVLHTVLGDIRNGISTMALQQINDADGRQLVSMAQLL